MKPQRTDINGTTEASALLFAHDATRAAKNLANTFQEKHDERKGLQLLQKHNDFFNHVMGEWLAEIGTEQRV